MGLSAGSLRILSPGRQPTAARVSAARAKASDLVGGFAGLAASMASTQPSIMAAVESERENPTPFFRGLRGTSLKPAGGTSVGIEAGI